ncbi:class II glutamine amidotransferase [Galactobacter caseinivorans]|uniref:Glutamine amidotransferase type-2 domain-containing protein n=1 Tax=Galactobacter caseinivorans TaxID=2676123 RepID=A0A496PJX3_9MICC|nr:class II glutamine amidotransferase [Galactobacter caseinivorans]RKW70803.1 hypothetical protein DWQ67_06845 [Galactobacter caseinivorans]
MCRLFGHVGTTHTTVSQVLGQDNDAFTALSGRHKDGWGLVGLERNGITRRGDTFAARDSLDYEAAARTLSSSGLLMHYRLASPGTPVIQENLHPFEATITGVGPVAFAHNGHVFDVPALRGLVAQHSDAPLRGTTDSESYAQLVFALMQQMGPERALSTAASMVQDVTDVVALNAILLTPTHLHALQWVEPTPRGDGFPSAPNPDLFAMRMRRSGGGVTVTSNEWEPTTLDWDEMPDRRVLSCERTA